MLDNIHTWHTRVTTFDCDVRRALRLSSQLKLQQEIGELHLNSVGLSYEKLYDNGLVFVLVGTVSKRLAPPTLGQDIVVKTWSRGSKGTRFFRCYEFWDTSGQLLVASQSSFVVVDPVTHVLQRPQHFDQFYQLTHMDRDGGCPPPQKIVVPEGMTETQRRPIRYSDIDYNGHVNNTVYADFLVDALPDSLSHNETKAFGISFLSESLLGDELTIHTGTEDNRVFFRGAHARGDSFTGWINEGRES